MTLQKVDSLIYKYYPPMDINETVISDNMVLFFNYQVSVDLNEQKSIFIFRNHKH